MLNLKQYKKYINPLIIIVTIIIIVVFIKKVESFSPQPAELTKSEIDIAEELIRFFNKESKTFDEYLTILTGTRFDKLISKNTYNEFLTKPDLQIEHVLMKM